MQTFVLALVCALGLFMCGPAIAAGPSESTECHVADDDCDGRIDEDTGSASDDSDGDGRVDEDAAGDAADDAGENQVDCDESASQDVAGAQIYTGGNGAEVCNEGGLAGAIEGRAIATTDDGGYVTVDGDNTNPAPANGYARLDQSGFHCGDTENQDSGVAQTTNTQEDCG